MRRRRAAVAALLALVACTQPDAERADARAAARNADLDALVTAVTTLHPEPFGYVSEPAWRADVAAARARAGGMRDEEFLATVARLTNLGERSGHGGVFPTDQAASLPILGLRLYAFEGQWYVVDSPDRSLVGARLVLPPHTIPSLTPMVPRDNQASLHARLASYLVVPALAMGSNASRTVSVVDATGRARDVEAPVVTPAAYAALAGLDVPQIPLALPRPSWAPKDVPWWSRWRGDALVVGYERVVGETFEGKKLRVFADGVRSAVAARRPRVVVVDIRRNPGGDTGAAAPLVTVLRELAGQRIPVRVLISRATYSAACVVFAGLDREIPLRFYGEATGGGSMTYGSPAAQTLPHSGIVFHVPTQAAGESNATTVDWIEPDVAVEQTWRDWQAGRDTVLDAALAA